MIPQAIPDWTLQQYMMGSPGQSPALQAGVDAFNMAQLPVIQNQMQLAGLGQSPAVAQSRAMGLSQALTPLIQSAMQNQLQAVQLNQGQTGLDQSAANLAANIYNQDYNRQMQAMNNASQTLLGTAANVSAPATQLQYTGQQQGIGNSRRRPTQQDTTQNVADSNRNEFLRLQGLGEASGTGVLGGFSPVTTTTSQSSK